MTTDVESFIWLHPGRAAGLACINGRALTVEVIARCAWWGNGDRALELNFEITHAQLLLACWYQARYGTRTWRERWGEWQRKYEGQMAADNWDAVPMPPAWGKVTRE